MNNKRSSLIILALLCITLLSSVGILPISATESVSNQNYAKYKSVRDELDAEMEAYLTLDTTNENTIAHKTNAIIGEYSKQAIDLYSTPEVQTTDLTESFELILAKGKLAGRISWIANLHTNASPTESVLAKHAELRAKLDTKTAVNDLNLNAEFATTVCVEMNRAVFREKLRDEAREDDSEKTSAIFQNGVARIELCSYAEIDGAEFISIYNEVMRVVSLQRVRDGAANELKKIYVIINEGESGFLENPFVKAFFDTVDGNLHVDESLTIKEINNALITASNGILDAKIASGAKYVFSYRETIKSNFKKDALLATDTGVFAPISTNLSNFKEDFYRAQTKDKIASLVSASETNTDLLALISEYTDDGGILDRCSAISSMDTEYKRASFRVSWYRDYASCKQSIEDILYLPSKEMSDKLTKYAKDEIYLVIDSEMKNADISQGEADDIFLSLQKKGRRMLEDLLCDAKAERFCIDHKGILADTSIEQNDRAALEKAMSEYDSILKSDALTAEKLKTQKNSLNDKYKALIKLCINLTATGDDAAVLINALNAISSDLAPYSLKAQADEYIIRADALGVLQKIYTSVTNTSSYQNYDSESKTSLAAAYRSAANAIIYASAGQSSLSDVLSKINSDAELSIERHDSIAKVRLAAKDSALSDVKKTVADAEAAINAESDIEKIRLLCENAVFRVECQIKGDEMRKQVNNLKADIDGLRALDAASKTVLKGEADLLFSSCNLASGATDKATLDNIVSDFESKLSALEKKSESASLSEGKRQFVEEIKKKVTDARTTVNGYSFINYTVQNASEGFLSKLEAIAKSFENNVSDISTGWNELESLKTLAVEDINKTLSEAYSAELLGAKESSKNSITEAFKYPDRYSNGNREKIENIISNAQNSLNGADTVERILAIRDAAISDIGKVYTLLDEAKEAAIKKIDELYSKLKKEKDSFSEAVFKEIDELYSHTKAEISQISVFEDKDRADVIANERCALMLSKKKDKIITSAQSSIGQVNAYPSGFNVSLNGYAATLTAKGQIFSDSSFSVFPFSNENAVKLIRSSVKDGKVFLSNGSVANKSIISSLRNCNVLVGLNMDYSASETTINGMYSISLLLPDPIDMNGILGIVYVRSGGGIEYFECNIDQRTISFDIPHFSNFYIVTERTVDLLPLIVILSIILSLEIAIIALLMLRRKKANSETVLASFFPMIPIFALAKITPSGAMPTVAILGILVICAGGVIAWLVSEELKQRAKTQKENRSGKALPSPAPIPAISLPEGLRADHSRLASPVRNEKNDTENTSEVSLSEILPDPDTVLVLDTVSVEEANDLMSDAQAKASLKEANGEAVPFTSYSRTGKKHEVNIDVISAAFSPNETVSLQSLKEKRLISRNAKAVKILARGTLDKPLTVIAQDFSTAAIKMITLTGGHAMIVERE